MIENRALDVVLFREMRCGMSSLPWKCLSAKSADVRCGLGIGETVRMRRVMEFFSFFFQYTHGVFSSTVVDIPLK